VAGLLEAQFPVLSGNLREHISSRNTTFGLPNNDPQSLVPFLELVAICFLEAVMA
jgi:hypothetical protein